MYSTIKFVIWSKILYYLNRHWYIKRLMIHVQMFKYASWVHQRGNRYIHTNNSSHSIFAWPRLQEILQEYYFSRSTGNCVLWYFEVCIPSTMFRNMLYKRIYCQRCIPKRQQNNVEMALPLMLAFHYWCTIFISMDSWSYKSNKHINRNCSYFLS